MARPSPANRIIGRRTGTGVATVGVTAKSGAVGSGTDSRMGGVGPDTASTMSAGEPSAAHAGQTFRKIPAFAPHRHTPRGGSSLSVALVRASLLALGTLTRFARARSESVPCERLGQETSAGDAGEHGPHGARAKAVAVDC